MSDAPPDAHFPDTHWTLIARIKSPDAAVAARALDDLCTQYHYPLYCYIRRRGLAHHDAQDVLHDFLAGLLRQRALERLEESRGRLRGYLSTALGRHIHAWRESEDRRDQPAVDLATALDFDAIAYRYQREQFTDADTPERVFERKWAQELLAHALATLGADCARRGKGALFAALRPVVERGGSLRGEDNDAIAASLGISAQAVRSALSRLMHEFRGTMRAAVRLTVEDDAEVDAELLHLLSLFGR